MVPLISTRCCQLILCLKIQLLVMPALHPCARHYHVAVRAALCHSLAVNVLLSQHFIILFLFSCLEFIGKKSNANVTRGSPKRIERSEGTSLATATATAAAKSNSNSVCGGWPPARALHYSSHHFFAACAIDLSAEKTPTLAKNREPTARSLSAHVIIVPAACCTQRDFPALSGFQQQDFRH